MTKNHIKNNDNANLSHNELKKIAKFMDTKGYKNMSKDKLLNILDEKKAKKNKIKGAVHTPSKKRLFKPKIMKKTIEFLYTPLKEQPIKQKIMARLMKEAIEVLYDSKIKNNEKIKKIKKILYVPKEEYYRPIKINGAFGDNYIEYQSNGNKDKILSIKEYLDIIK